MKTLELEPRLEGTTLTFDIPADVAAAIAYLPGVKLRLEVPDPDPSLPPMPKPGDGVEAWRAWHEAIPPLSEDFACPPKDDHLDRPPADLTGIS